MENETVPIQSANAESADQRLKRIEAYCDWCEDHGFTWAWSMPTEDLRFLLDQIQRAAHVQ